MPCRARARRHHRHDRDRRRARRRRHHARGQRRPGDQGLAGRSARRPARRRHRPLRRRRRSRAVVGVAAHRRRDGRRRHHRHLERRTARWPGPGSARWRCSSAPSSSGRSWPGPRPRVLGAGAAVTRGFAGRLARRNAMRNPRRIAGSAAALMVGTAVVALFTTFGASIKASIDDIVDNNFAGDLVILPDDFSGAAAQTRRCAGHRRCPRSRARRAVGAAYGPAIVGGKSTDVAAPTSATLDRRLRPRRLVGDRSTASATARSRSSERYAEDHDLRLGSTIPMTFDRRRHDRPHGGRHLRGPDDVRRPPDHRRPTGRRTPRQAADAVVSRRRSPTASTAAAGQAAVAAVTDRVRRPRTDDPGGVHRLGRR